MSTQPNTPPPPSINRMMECSSRRERGCGRIDIALGWIHGMAIEDCSKCWERGCDTTGAADYRRGYVQMVISGLNLATVKPRVLVNILKKHTPADQQKARLLQLAPTLGRETAMQIAKEFGCEGAVYAVFADMTIREEIDKTHPAVRWSAVAKAWHYAQAKISKGWTDKKVDESIKQLRASSCADCPSKYTGKDGHAYCNECGCGEKDDTRLDGEGYTKLDYPYLPCPRQMPGFSNALLTVEGAAP